MSLRLVGRYPVALGLLVLVLFGGCLTLLYVGSSASDPKPLPERPASLDNESVADYLTSLEEATIYNRYLEHGPTENRVTCEARVGARIDSTYVASVQCMGGVPLHNGEHIDVATRTQYAVSPNATKRVPASAGESRSYDGSRAPDSVGSGYEVVNVGESATDVTVTFPKTDSNRSDLQFEYSIRPNSSVMQSGLPYRFGTSRRMRIETDAETRVTRFESREIEFAPTTVVYVLPDGRIVSTRVNATV